VSFSIFFYVFFAFPHAQSQGADGQRGKEGLRGSQRLWQSIKNCCTNCRMFIRQLDSWQSSGHNHFNWTIMLRVALN